jgi:hypothetical protein
MVDLVVLAGTFLGGFKGLPGASIGVNVKDGEYAP